MYSMRCVSQPGAKRRERNRLNRYMDTEEDMPAFAKKIRYNPGLY